MGYEVIENHDLGAGPVHVVWLFKPGSESLPDMRLGFICLTEFSNSSINEGIARAMLKLIDKLVFVVPIETMTKEVKDAIESMPDTGLRYFGIESEMVDLLEGRIAPQVFVRHYWRPNFKQDMDRVRKAIDSLMERFV